MTELNVGVRELKTHLSEYLREVQKGKTVVITDHGKPVGRLIPAALPREDRVEALRRAGVITWSGQKPQPVTPIAKRRGSGDIATLLVEDRE
jgi:prevent-host-death family protein